MWQTLFRRSFPLLAFLTAAAVITVWKIITPPTTAVPPQTISMPAVTLESLRTFVKQEWIGTKVTNTRFGNELRHFDHWKCPPDSVILNKTRLHMAPLHSDCPTVFIVGAPKGGTTSMLQYLSKHPDFQGAALNKRGFMAGEMHYFNVDGKFRKVPWEKYIKNFPSGVATGESTAVYLLDCKAPKRIFQCCGNNSKVVMLLRNPISRLISFYVMIRMMSESKGKHAPSLEEYVEKQLWALKRSYSNTSLQFEQIVALNHEWMRCMPKDTIAIYGGLYYVQVMNWLCNFPSQNIMIINSEEFYSHTSRVMVQVLKFLGLNPISGETYTSSTIYNKGNYHNRNDCQLPKTLLKELEDFYQPFNDALFELLDWNSMHF